MSHKIKKQILVNGMTCSGCEFRIENKLKKIPGVIHVKADYAKSNVDVEFDRDILNIDKINEAIASIGYEVGSAKDSISFIQFIGLSIVIIAIYIIIKNTIGFSFIPKVEEGMGYGLLFIIGLMTSVHCIAMCGGINLSQCINNKSSGQDKGYIQNAIPSLLYNGGRVVSYTLIGGLVGALGSVVSFSGTLKGLIAILSGVFMLIIGLNMMGIFLGLRKFIPKMPKLFANKIYSNKRNMGPFFIGLLNGLMPCGPLQSMQIYALGTGSALKGALSMLFFSLGTFILMFLFGVMSTFISGKFTAKMIKLSALLVMFLGIIMIGNGFSLSGISVPSISGISSNDKNVAKVQGNIQIVTTKLKSGEYDPIVVKKGVPVRWIINAEEENINGCNNEIIIPKYNISKKLSKGDNIIEFMPDEEGVIGYSCWMGMIKSDITVKN